MLGNEFPDHRHQVVGDLHKGLRPILKSRFILCECFFCLLLIVSKDSVDFLFIPPTWKLTSIYLCLVLTGFTSQRIIELSGFFPLVFSYNSLMLFINSLGVTILLPSNSSKGKCLLFPVIIKSALAFIALSKILLSGSSTLTIFNRLVGVTIDAFRLIFPISSAICF